MYKADHGTFPVAMTSCLGDASAYGRGFGGSESTGGQCLQDSSSHGGINSSTTFNSAMSEYVSGHGPTPALATHGSASYPWYRGAYYHSACTGSAARIDYVLEGVATPCTEIGGAVSMTRSVGTESDTVRCSVRLEVAP